MINQEKEMAAMDLSSIESSRVPSYSQMVNVRNVLLEMRDSSDPAVVNFAKKLSDALARDCYCQICGRILKDQPIRNCDVGTAKEQYERFRDYCYTKKCPSITKDNTFSQIAFMWAQMPYEKAENQ